MVKTAFFTLLFAFMFSPISFATVQEGTASNSCPPGEHWVQAHIQSAYVRSDGTPVSGSNHAFVEWCKPRYKRITTLIENKNTVMLKMAMKVGFRVIGVRNFQGSILLEHLLEFSDAGA